MEDINVNDLDLNVEEEMIEIPKKVKEKKVKNTVTAPVVKEQKPVVNCLRKEKIIVRHIPKQTGMITNPKHVLYGGMSETAVRYFVVPILASGLYVNILTDDEKACLEEVMGLEYNALSIYKKNDNFWDCTNEAGINTVRLTKEDTHLDLSNPQDYIKYKILLANKETIAPSLEALQLTPKATYQFVLISEGEEVNEAKDKMSLTMKCYTQYGKIEDDFDKLRFIVETIDGRPIGANTKKEFLQTKINDIIQADAKTFYKVANDPMMDFKIIIKKGIEAGIIANRADQLYLRQGNIPLCELGQESTLPIAAQYLANPKHQDVLFAIQAKLNT
jgi:hypothetical protein